MEMPIVQYTALSALVVVMGILTRVLMKPDARWERLVDELQEQVTNTAAERDMWRDKYLALANERREG